jgi:nucleoside-diphosphate-sugar epimerase
MDSGRINAMGWNPKISLEQGIASTYAEVVPRL